MSEGNPAASAESAVSACRLYTVAEVVELTRLSEAKVRAAIRDGLLASIKLGRRSTRVSGEALVAFVRGVTLP